MPSLLLALIHIAGLPALGAPAPIPQDLAELSLEELMDIEVTMVSRKTQRLVDAPAAVYVITQDDIRRTGVTTLPDALRMVPGMEVARINGNQWAITARGFNARSATKLLVLVDGRSVYTPLFAGVFWETQDVLFEDIDRIEVVRGPGAALWGANAVNGIINVVTRPSDETRGVLLSGGGGTEESGFGAVRVGGTLRPGLAYRIYGKYFDRDRSVSPSGGSAYDAWRMGRGGFRLDWRSSASSTLSVQGDAYRGLTELSVTAPLLTSPYEQTRSEDATVDGLNVLARWSRTFSPSSDASLQFYYDRTEREDVVLPELRDTFDLDFQHRFSPARRHEIIWGAGYRYTHDRLANGLLMVFIPESDAYAIYSAFAQDEIALYEGILRLTLGTKLEHNDYTGVELLPNVRFLWHIGTRSALWGAVSRAVRLPTRGERDAWLRVRTLPPNLPFVNPEPIPALAVVKGDDGFGSEELVAHEAGYRVVVHDRLSIDIAAFYNRYRGLRTTEPDSVFPVHVTDPPPEHNLLPFVLRNKARGLTYGVELGSEWLVSRNVRLRGSYSHLRIDLEPDQDSRDAFVETVEGESPRSQASLRASVDLPRSVELDVMGRYVGPLADLGVNGYASLDGRIGWTPVRGVQVSLVGQNLLHAHHHEFIPGLQGVTRHYSEIQRGLYASISWTH